MNDQTPMAPPSALGAPPPEVEDRAERVQEHAQALAKKPMTLKDLLKTPDFLKAVAEVAPKVMRPDRFVRAALTAMIRTPDLALCTRDSFFMAMLDCAFYGLEPDRRRAHLIPFKNRKAGIVECQLIIDYKGLAELVLRSGDISFLHADFVCEDDFFEVEYGTHGHLTHKPGKDRTSQPIQFYSYARMKDGSDSYTVMSLAEVAKIRRRSKSPDEGPWVTDFNEMGKKTVFRNHSKWLPLSPEARFHVDRSEPEAVDVNASNAWSEMITEGAAEAQQRLTARDKVLNPPSLDDDPTAPAE